MNIIEASYKWNGELKKRQETKYIIVHHAAHPNCSVQDIHQWHIEKGWAGIGYHFFTRKDGNIYRGRPIDTVGAHTLGQNEISIGVCLEGNLDIEDMPTAQADALVELLIYLQRSYPGAKVAKHKDFNDTSCPGRNFQNSLLSRATEQKHWAEEYYTYLNENGVEIKEKRFDDKISRGESFALLARLLKTLKG